MLDENPINRPSAQQLQEQLILLYEIDRIAELDKREYSERSKLIEQKEHQSDKKLSNEAEVIGIFADYPDLNLWPADATTADIKVFFIKQRNLLVDAENVGKMSMLRALRHSGASSRKEREELELKLFLQSQNSFVDAHPLDPFTERLYGVPCVFQSLKRGIACLLTMYMNHLALDLAALITEFISQQGSSDVDWLKAWIISPCSRIHL